MGDISQIPAAHVVAGENDRKDFDPAKLADLAENIDEFGLAQPITVRPVSSLLGQKYEIVCGERRFRAMALLGWEKIPAIVSEMSDERASAIMLAENTARADLNAIEEANAYQSRSDRFEWDDARIAKLAGIGTGRVRSRRQLLQLHVDVQHLVRHGNMPLGHAGAMTILDDNRQLIALRIFREGKSVPLAKFRRIVGELEAEQNQDSLFDLATYFVEQINAADELPLRGRRADVPVPTRDDLPKPVYEQADSASAVILKYVRQLQADGHEVEAGAIGTLYKELVHSNSMALPDWAAEGATA